MYKIDKLGTASTCTNVGTASIDCQIHLVADVGTTETNPPEGERELKGRGVTI
jgi:hypothetical protein